MYITYTYTCIHTHWDSYYPGLTFKILGKTFCFYKSKTAYQRVIGGMPICLGLPRKYSVHLSFSGDIINSATFCSKIHPCLDNKHDILIWLL